MSLYEEWKKLQDNQTDDSFKDFWKEYSDGEVAIYTYILAHHRTHLKGKVSELAEKFSCRPVIFEGFLDGITSSLKKDIDVESVDEDSEIDLSVDFEKLYYNMHKADAAHLYGLPQWEKVLDEEKRASIVKEYNKSKVYHAPKKPGRNDPCPCGSGKKYKNCCGKNL